MMKTARFNFTSLFRLIKSLTMSERIYFKKFTTVSVPNVEGKLLELFNTLEGMSVFELHKIELASDKKKAWTKPRPFFHFYQMIDFLIIDDVQFFA